MTKIAIELHNHQKINYEGVVQVKNEKNNVIIFGEEGVLAIIQKGDIMRLITEE
jgi:predicted transcriptional regulator